LAENLFLTDKPEIKQMWIFTNEAFLSIVADPKSNQLLVRARVPGDLERAFPGVPVKEGGGTDYRFRAWVDRETVAGLLYREAMNISYGNFKGSVVDIDRHAAYLDVWSQMLAYQRRKQANRLSVREPGCDDELSMEFWNPVKPTETGKSAKPGGPSQPDRQRQSVSA
jgi:hypothetical protein